MKSRDIEEALKWWIVLCIGALLGMGLMSWLEYIKELVGWLVGRGVCFGRLPYLHLGESDPFIGMH